MSRYFNANQIMNRVAVEVGIPASNDAFSDNDQSFLQMGALLNSCGQELSAIFDWEIQSLPFEVTVGPNDTTGIYLLPTDYGSMVDQSGWDLINNVPIRGPLSDQEWALLLGRNFLTNTIYPAFRINQGKLEIYPSPPPEGSRYSFQYEAIGWAFNGFGFSDEVTNGAELVAYNPIMFIKMLKYKWLSAKGMDSSMAQLEFDNLLQSQLGKDRGAPLLNAGHGGFGIRYLDNFYNSPDSGYGM
jgi:hypothetical protein